MCIRDSCCFVEIRSYEFLTILGIEQQYDVENNEIGTYHQSPYHFI